MGKHTMKNRIKIKLLSVNRAWQGRRYKTADYSAFETELLYLLPKLEVPKKTQLMICLVFGFSNANQDIDSPIKLVLDIFQKAYNFNDKMIYVLWVKKEKVKIGQEFLEFSIEKI